MPQKKILSYITNRTTEFGRVSLLFIQKFIHEVDEFYIMTTPEAYENFFKHHIHFEHKKVLFNNDDFYPNKLGQAPYLYCDFLCNNTERGSIIYTAGDGGFIVKNPFTWIQEHHNNFNTYDIVNCIHKHYGPNGTYMCFDTGAFFINNERSQLFFQKLIHIANNPPRNITMLPNAKINVYQPFTQISKWLIIQEIFWNIYKKNSQINDLTNTATVLFVTDKWHWAGDSGTESRFIATLYDSLFVKDECIINLLGRFKNTVNQEIYQYYYDIIDNLDNIMPKQEFINKFLVNNTKKQNEILNHYKKLFNNKY